MELVLSIAFGGMFILSAVFYGVMTGDRRKDK